MHKLRGLLKADRSVFIFFWLTTFLFYLPAMESGKVGDYYKDWLAIIKHDTFMNYLNRIDTPTLFQFTQLVTWVFYKLFGAAAIPWHLLHLTLHVSCGYALFRLFVHLLQDANVIHARVIAFCTSLLFCLSAYNTEVVVHEPCFHYTIAFLMQLYILLQVRRYIFNGRSKHLVAALVIFLLSAFSLEIFYITPWLVFGLAFYYHLTKKGAVGTFKGVMLKFVLPSLLIFIGHLILLKSYTGYSTPHYIDPSAANQFHNVLVKFPKYLFHILLMGRFWPHELKTNVYGLCETLPLLVAFYGALAASAIAYIVRFRKLAAKWQLLGLIVFILGSYAIVVATKEFYQLQWVVYDRYAYMLIPFAYMALALMVFTPRNKWLPASLFAILLVANCYFLLRVNIRWYRSQKIVTSLVKTFPDPGDKTVLILNSPENMDGVLMIGSHPLGYFKMMHELEQKPLPNKIMEVASYNLANPGDGAHVEVLSDSTLKITLNQWGTWWWYHYGGAGSYENEDYKVDMRDQGHWYELTLKKPADQYMVLFVTDGRWRQADMTRQHIEQY